MNELLPPVPGFLVLNTVSEHVSRSLGAATAFLTYGIFNLRWTNRGTTRCKSRSVGDGGEALGGTAPACGLAPPLLSVSLLSPGRTVNGVVDKS